jgi:hypothetical protein
LAEGLKGADAVTLKRVRLELARSPEFPDGSARHGYEFILPLTEEGKLDRETWEEAPEICTVHRFWEGEGDNVGTLIRTGRGRWVFSYVEGESDDEPIHRFADHVFREGEYLSLREPGGEPHTFKIVLVRDAPGLTPVQ